MDAVKFIVEQVRMCNSHTEDMGCESCGLNNSEYCTKLRDSLISQAGAEEAVRIVKAWSQEHPRKTRQDVFLEHYPDAALDNGILQVCPRIIYKSAELNCNAICYLCKEAFWMQEVE